MNEATFEAQFNSAIQQVFPNYASLGIKHQLIFSFKVGHEDITVRPSVKRPRLDVLLKHNNINLAIMELKKPNHPLTDEDRLQGLSYASLLLSHPPIVIISNGNETQYYNSSDGTPLDMQGLDATQLEKVFETASKVAMLGRNEAIRTLLGKDPILWKEAIETLNQRGFENQSSSIEQYSEAIAESFHLPRNSVHQIKKLLNSNNPVIAVTGNPLVGKTNVLYQLCQLEDQPFVPLYINTIDCTGGIFQYIANYFNERFFSVTSENDARHWFRHGITTVHPAGKLVLIIDDVRYTQTNLIHEIDELIKLCVDSTSCSLIIACDSSTFAKMSTVEGRPGKKSLIGKKALKVKIENLSDDELEQANTYLMETQSARFDMGAKYSKELRVPRILRMIVSGLPKELKPDTILIIPSSLHYRSLDWIKDSFSADVKFMNDMVNLVTAALDQESYESSNPIVKMASYGRGSVLYTVAEGILGEGRLERLLEQGHIELFTDKEENRYVMPKVPELLAAVAIEVILKNVSGLKFEEVLVYVLDTCERLPYGDLIAANVFMKLSLNPVFPVIKLFENLIHNQPVKEKAGGDFTGALYSDELGLVTIPPELFFTPEEDTLLFANLFPWLVLSQLVTQPFIQEGEDITDGWYVYRTILTIVGGYPNVLRRFDPLLNIMEPFSIPTHEMRSKKGLEGEVICGEMGIIEPITFAMQQGFYLVPDEMIKICKTAVNEDNPFLSHRLHNAAIAVVDTTKISTSFVARSAIEILKPILHPHRSEI
ncbi:type I restriction endonuclease [Paenibacillus sp. BAC0078]